MHFSVVTDMLPEAAFDAVADFGVLAEWDPFVRAVDVEGPPMAIGTKYVLHTRSRMILRYSVVVSDRPRQVVYAGGTRHAHTTDTLSVRPRDSGSEIHVQSILQFTGWVRLIGPVVRLAVWAGGRFVSLPALRRRLARG